MTVGIIGLGLIGGSLAKAFCREEGNTVLGWDTDSTIVEFAQIAQAIHGPLTDERLGELDLLLLATYPEAVVEHMTRLAPLLSKHTMVIDCAGTKEKVCAGVFPLAERYGFRFLGGHPMAGTHFSGFKYSRADLFDGAPMVIVPPDLMTSGCWTRRKSCWLLWALGGFPLPRPRSMTSGSPSPPRWPT